MRSEQRLSSFEPVAVGFTYLRRGLAITRRDPLLYLAIVVVYAAPALIASYLAATVREPSLGEQAAMVTLPWVTAVLGTVVVMIAVSYHAHGRPVGLGRASWEALPWVPRYFWTNCHTTPIFWIPVGLLLTARIWQETVLPLAGAPQLGLGLLWWLLIAVVAVSLHTRTLLAPFLAVHGDLPGTLATLEAWRLSGRYFALCLSTFLVATLPVAFPLGLVSLALIVVLPDPALTGFIAAWENLFVAGIQAVRPILIPAVYLLYQDLWHAELARGERLGAPPVPFFARALLLLTKPLPKLGHWQ